MREVANPSAIFLQRGKVESPGSVATVIWEGTRPILVEIQALVNEVQGGYARRVAVGLDQQRLAMHLARAARHCGVHSPIRTFSPTWWARAHCRNRGGLGAVAGGVCPLFVTVPCPGSSSFSGELGLTRRSAPGPQWSGAPARGEQTPAFKIAIAPHDNRPREAIAGMAVHGVKNLSAALEAVASL